MPKRRRQRNIQIESDKVAFRVLMIVSIVFVALPFLFVKFVPATDLPQHLAQIRLIEEIIGNPQQTTYTINWYGANSLVYGLLGLNWMIFDPVLTGKMTLLEIALGWCVSVFLLARRGRRTAFAAVLASIFIFNANLYWGLLAFSIGFPVFAFWCLFVIDSTDVRQRSIWKEFFLVCLMSILLFMAHVLWLLAAALILIIADVRRRAPLHHIWPRWLGLMPIAIYCALWFSKFAAAQSMSQRTKDMLWLVLPLERINPSWITEFALGGIRGPIDVFVYGGVLLWIGASIATQWGNIRRTINVNYVLIGILLLSFSFLGPDEYMDTILLAARWFSIGVIFLLLGLPVPRISTPYTLFASTVFLAVFSVTTAVQWHRFEATENSGLKESLESIRNDSNVLGLDFKRTSGILYGRPFLQTFAYAQAIHGGRLNFSFAEYHRSIVSFAHSDTTTTLTRRLEWFPDRVRFGDLRQFDYVLICGSDEIHRTFASIPMLAELTTDGNWRLYQCRKDSTIMERPQDNSHAKNSKNPREHRFTKSRLKS
jgi:hypothetical protein